MGLASGISIVKLACISCGASLEIANDIEQIACAHCGTPQRLERSGGAIFLKGITDTLSQVKQGTDKTAAELAIVRLTKEYESIQLQRDEYERQYKSEREVLIRGWFDTIEKNRITVNAIATIAFLVTVISIGIPIGSALFQVTSIPREVTILILGSVCLVVALLARAGMHKLDDSNPSRLRDKRDDEVSRLDEKARNEFNRYDARLAELQQKIQQNYSVAEAP